MVHETDMGYVGPDLCGVRPTRAALAVLQALEGAGLEAWIVGGWVRDALMGAPGHDIDICCSGSWEDNACALRDCDITVVESGTKFGGITAVLEGERIEVTAYRLDGFYLDGRHPEQVERASTVEEDLARRDFTVNALAWHPERGLLDCHDGAGDIRRRVIRAVGEPARRFEEDALRMLRAVRFACRLDFRIEPETSRALAECAPLLDQVARERVGIELDGMLVTGRGGDALMRHPDLICAAIPELCAARGFDQHTPYHDYDVYEHTARVLTVAGELSRFRIDGGDPDAPPSPSLMWAALLHDVAKPDTFSLDEQGRGHFYGHPQAGADLAVKIMRRLACPSDLIRDVRLLILHHDRPLRPEREDLLRMMHALSAAGGDAPRLMGELLDLKRADTLGKATGCFYYVDEIELMRERARELLANGESYDLKTLALTGRDLIDAGLAPGPVVGKELARALEGVMAGSVPNERDELLAFLDLN